MIHEIGADGAVDPAHEGDAQLGPDAVRTRDEHGIRQSAIAQPKQAAERSDLGQHAGRERPAREPFNPSDDLVAGVDVDARILVVHD